MDITIYGGSFNPPHLGHVAAARSALELLRPDRLLVIPAAVPPHKQIDTHSPSGAVRLALCREMFRGLPATEVSDLELSRSGPSYTVETLIELRRQYPGARLTLLIGTDMLESFTNWYCFQDILAMSRLGVFTRKVGESVCVCKFAAKLRDTYNADVVVIPHEPLPLNSTEIRSALPCREGRTGLGNDVYAMIVQQRLYGVKPELAWLREQVDVWLQPSRIPHVRGCEAAAVRLAKRWGVDAGLAAEAAILHDVTKKLEFPAQLSLCQKYGESCDAEDRKSPKTIHAKTGALVARESFGASQEVYEAIRWHTTGRANMSMLEKIIYIADYIEPNRDFPGVERLRQLAHADLNAAVKLGLEMTLEEIQARGLPPHSKSMEALAWFQRVCEGN